MRASPVEDATQCNPLQEVSRESQQQSSNLVLQVADLQQQLAKFTEHENRRTEELFVKVGIGSGARMHMQMEEGDLMQRFLTVP